MENQTSTQEHTDVGAASFSLSLCVRIFFLRVREASVRTRVCVSGGSIRKKWRGSVFEGPSTDEGKKGNDFVSSAAAATNLSCSRAAFFFQRRRLLYRASFCLSSSQSSHAHSRSFLSPPLARSTASHKKDIGNRGWPAWRYAFGECRTW